MNRNMQRKTSQLAAAGVLWGTLVAILFLAPGCSRPHYRRWADSDAYQLINAANRQTETPLPRTTINFNPMSRFYDPYNPDRPPMPPDDPISHRLMHYVANKKGYKHWHKNGDVPSVESPDWQAYLPYDENGEVTVTLDGAMRLGLVNSRDYQLQFEELYLSALDVAFERFRFNLQFFGGNSTFFTSDGRLHSKPTGGAPFGQASSVLNTSTNMSANKMSATGAQIVTSFANSLIWQFSGPNRHSAISVIDFSLIQPLLRAGGRIQVMERLTVAERTLLANARAMERYQREYFVDIATGRAVGNGPSRQGGFFGGAGLSGFSGIGGGGFGRIGGATTGGNAGGFNIGGAGAASANGYLGLLQDQRTIANQQANVDELCSSLRQLEEEFRANRINLLQVNQARQSLYDAQSVLMTARTAYQTTLDAFKVDLGLPPHLSLKIEDNLIYEFELLPEPMMQLRREELPAFEARLTIPPPEAHAWLDEQLQNSVAAASQAPPELGDRWEQALTRLASYPAATKLAGQLQLRAREQICRLAEAVADFKANKQKRIESLREIRLPADVHCEAAGTPFSIDEFEQRVEKAEDDLTYVIGALLAPSETASVIQTLKSQAGQQLQAAGEQGAKAEESIVKVLLTHLKFRDIKLEREDQVAALLRGATLPN